MKGKTLFAAVSILAAAGPLAAQALTSATVIDFESFPDGSPLTEGTIIHDQYAVTPYWVTFELVGVDPSVGPTHANVGPPATAFWGVDGETTDCSSDTTMWDKPRNTENVGCWFLTDNDTVAEGLGYTLLVTYTQPVTWASGDILDVDFGEEWTVTARACDESILGQVVIAAGDAGTGNGKATPWQLSSETAICFITLEMTDVDGGGGFAFDNFSFIHTTTTSTENTSWGDVKSLFR